MEIATVALIMTAIAVAQLTRSGSVWSGALNGDDASTKPGPGPGDEKRQSETYGVLSAPVPTNMPTIAESSPAIFRLVNGDVSARLAKPQMPTQFSTPMGPRRYGMESNFVSRVPIVNADQRPINDNFGSRYDPPPIDYLSDRLRVGGNGDGLASRNAAITLPTLQAGSQQPYLRPMVSDLASRNLIGSNKPEVQQVNPRAPIPVSDTAASFVVPAQKIPSLRRNLVTSSRNTVQHDVHTAASAPAVILESSKTNADSRLVMTRTPAMEINYQSQLGLPMYGSVQGKRFRGVPLMYERSAHGEPTTSIDNSNGSKYAMDGGTTKQYENVRTHSLPPVCDYYGTSYGHDNMRESHLEPNVTLGPTRVMADPQVQPDRQTTFVQSHIEPQLPIMKLRPAAEFATDVPSSILELMGRALQETRNGRTDAAHTQWRTADVSALAEHIVLNGSTTMK